MRYTLVPLVLWTTITIGCAEPSPVSNDDPPTPPTPSRAATPDDDTRQRLGAQWDKLKDAAAARAQKASPVSAKGPDLSLTHNEEMRQALQKLYKSRPQGTIFINPDGTASPQGIDAIALTEKAWTHGIPAPEGWPNIDALLKRWRQGPKTLSDAFHAPLQPQDLQRHWDKEAENTLDTSLLTSQSLQHLDTIESLPAQLAANQRALDTALVLGVWMLARAIDAKAVPCPVWPRKRRRACKRARKAQQNTLLETPESMLARVAPRHPDYQKLRNAFERYVNITDAGGFPALPTDTPKELGPGQRHPSVTALRARLNAEGYPAAPNKDADADLYDAPLSEQVRAFQFTRGLRMTGLLDKPTQKALQIPAAHLVEQLQLNLVRWHRSRARHEDYYVRVSITRYQVQLVDGPEVLSRIKAVVGKPWKQTPRFNGVITHLETHPWWWGLADDPKRVPPGPANPLGPLVFRVQPRHLLIYLHGTNEPRLLDKPYRAYSHGCIRMKDPGELGELVLDRDPGKATGKDMRNYMAGKRRTRRLMLANPLPVLFEYTTAYVDDDTGHVHFTPDIYRQDAAHRARWKLPVDPHKTWTKPAPQNESAN